MIRRFLNSYLSYLPILVLEWMLQSLLSGIDGPLGLLLRRVFYPVFIGRSHGRFFIYPRVSFQHAYALEIGRDTCVNTGSVLDARGGLKIGSACLIGPNVVVVSSTHDTRAEPISSAPHIALPTKIGDDVWIGANAVILGGLTIADGCVIGAGAVLTKSTEAMGIYAGNPARLIKRRVILTEAISSDCSLREGK